MKHTIHIFPAKKIDRKKWNHCVSKNTNGLIYSSSVYLDAISENWHGLVIDDYSVVMALPWKKKFGIRYAYTLPFVQQLGLIGDTTAIDLGRVLHKIYKFISFADILFNFSNTDIQAFIPVIPRTNLVLNLEQSLDSIRLQYKNDLKENIKKAEMQQLCYVKENDFDASVSAYRLQYSERMRHIKKEHYRKFLHLCKLMTQKNQAFTRSVTDNKGMLLATAIFFKDDKRIYNLMNTTLPEGRDKEANHFLLDRVITEFAGQSLLFDFEGSELPGVRHFYEKFGAENQPYFHYHYNGYSWPLRLLKK